MSLWNSQIDPATRATGAAGGVWPQARLVNEMHSDPGHGDRKMPKRVQLGLLEAPVVSLTPVRHEGAQVRRSVPYCQLGPGDLVGPAHARQPRL